MVIVRAEEILLVVLVLVIWVAAIALFFNRWGKIRMLEPYQPKFQQNHRASCPLSPPTTQVSIQGRVQQQQQQKNRCVCASDVRIVERWLRSCRIIGQMLLVFLLDLCKCMVLKSSVASVFRFRHVKYCISKRNNNTPTGKI